MDMCCYITLALPERPYQASNAMRHAARDIHDDPGLFSLLL